MLNGKFDAEMVSVAIVALASMYTSDEVEQFKTIVVRIHEVTSKDEDRLQALFAVVRYCRAHRLSYTEFAKNLEYHLILARLGIGS